MTELAFGNNPLADLEKKNLLFGDNPIAETGGLAFGNNPTVDELKEPDKPAFDFFTPEATEEFIREQEEGLRKAKERVVSGVFQATAGFWRLLKGGTRYAKALEEVGLTDRGFASAPPATQLMLRGADYLAGKFDGTRKGALDLLEEQFNRFEKAQLDLAGESDPSLGGQLFEGLGRLPLEGMEMVIALTAGGPLALGALFATEKAGEEGSTPLEISGSFGGGVVMGQFFKWIEGFLPKTPADLPLTKPAGRPVAEPLPVTPKSRLNVNYDPPAAEPSLLGTPGKIYAETLRETYALEKAGAMLGDKELIDTARILSGNNGTIASFLEFGGRTALDKAPTGNPGLLSVMRKVPRKQHTGFQDFLVARHSLSLEEQGIRSGQPLEEAAKIVQEGSGNRVWVEAADDFYRAADDVFRYAVDSGLISEEGYAIAKSKHPFYVPMFREGFAETGISGAIPGGVRQPLKAIKGSERTVRGPFRAFVEQTTRIVNSGDVNRLGNSLALHEGKPGAELLIRRIEGVAPVAESSTARGELLESIPEVFLEATAKEAGVPFNFQKIRLYDKGRPTDWMVDPDIANAIGTYNLKGDASLINKVILNTLSAPAQLLRAGVTDNPVFILKNLIRDLATLPFQTKTGAQPGIAQLDGLMSYLARDEAYKRWLSIGGPTATNISIDRSLMRKTIRELMAKSNRSHWRDIGELALTPFRALQEISQAIEAAPRLGEFKQGIRNIARTGQVEAPGLLNRINTIADLGRPGAFAKGLEKATPAQIKRAGIASKDVTADFGMKGRSSAAQAIRKIIPFMNARYQGLDRFARIHKENPVKAALMGTLGITIPSLYLHNQQMKDPQYKETYRRLPTWRKFFFWNLDPRLLGREWDGRLIPIPAPWEWGMVYKAVPEAALSAYELEDPKILTRLAETLANEVLPFAQIQNGKITTNAGPALQPFFDIGANRKSFFNSPIHTERELKLPPEMRFDENTSRSAQIMSGWMDGYYSPKEVEVLVQGWTGGLGRTGLNISDRLIKTGPFGDVPRMRAFGDKPFLDAVLGGYHARTVEEGGSQVVTDFWDEYNRTRKIVNGFEDLQKSKLDPVGAAEFYSENQNDITQGQRLDKYVRQMRPLNTQKHAILRNRFISRSEKRKAIKSLNRSIDIIASKALGVPLLPEQRGKIFQP